VVGTALKEAVNAEGRRSPADRPGLRVSVESVEACYMVSVGFRVPQYE